MRKYNDDFSKPTDLVKSYYADISSSRFAEAAAKLAADCTTWVSGEGDWPLGGHHDLNSLKKIHGIISTRFPQGLNVNIKAMTAEGERVAVEAESDGVRCDGLIYQNQYHFLLVIKNGLICERKEYLNTIHANDLLCGPLKQAAY